MDAVPIDLPLDLASEDETGLPWSFLDEAYDPSRIVEGAWIVVGSMTANAEAQVAGIDGEIVHARPLPGPLSRHRQLLRSAVA
jgi:hypothetical protein